MDKEFIMATAKEAERQILWSIDKWAYMSWGIRRKVATEYEGMATLALRVSGLRHKGWVLVSLNEGKDCYEVRLMNVARTKVKRMLEEVYCDNLGEVLDGLIEKDPTLPDDKYRDKAMRDSARRMGMKVIDSPKSDNSSIINNQNKEDNTMRLNMNQNQETKNAAQQQVNNNKSEDVVKQVDVIGMMNGLKTNGTAKLSDYATPVEDAQAEEVVESVAVGEMTVDSIMPKMSAEPEEPTKQESGGQVLDRSSRADQATCPPDSAVTMPLGQHGTLVIGGVPKPTEKPKVTLKEKTPQPAEPDPEAVGELAGMLTKVRLTTFTTKRGDTAPRIIGFSGEDDPRWKQHYAERMALAKAVKAAKAKDPKAKGQSDPFGASWMTDHQTGSVTYCMTFGVRYMDVAKQLVEAYNTTDRNLWKQAEQAVVDTKNGIVAGYQAEKAARRAAREAEREAQNTQPSAVSPQPSSGKTYTAADMEATIREAFGALAGVLKADVKQFEPLIAAAIKKAA